MTDIPKRPYRKTKTRFTRLIRISPTALQWLQQNKDTKTDAGFLDKIINYYRQNH